MEGIKYVNLIEIGPVVIEIRGVENDKLAVPVNNTLVRHTAFLIADTRPCVLMQFSYSIEFNVFGGRSDTSRGIYPRAAIMTVFALHPEAIIQGWLL